MEFFVNYFQIFLLIFARIIGIFATAPLFSSGTIPLRIRAVAAVYIAACIFPVTVRTFPSVPENIFAYGLLIAAEAFIGILIGFLLSVIFAAFQLATRFFSFQMALGIAEVIDPLSEIGITLVGQLWTVMGLMVFIAIDGPNMLVMAGVESFQRIQIFSLAENSQAIMTVVLNAFGAMFIVALKLSFPILITLFLVSVVLGLLAKAAPQMNIFMVGFPIQIGVGLLIIIVTTGAIALGMSSALHRAFENLFEFIRAFAR
jgi:flagellar biosynthetic protein FliR